MSAIRKLLHLNASDPTSMTLWQARERYELGDMTWKEVQYRAGALSRSTNSAGKKFHYVCPKCSAPLKHCPDPACAEEGMGHHMLEEDWEGCDEDVPYSTALMYYDDIVVDNAMMEEIEKELEAAVQAVLAKYDCEFHGRLTGILQQKGHPETANGRNFQVGDGVPKGWPKHG